MKQIFQEKQPTLLLETGSNRVMMCLNEEQRTVEEPAPVEGAAPTVRTDWLYDVTWLEPDDKTRGSLISAVVRSRFSADEVEAILNNFLANPDDEVRKQEFDALQQWRVEAKRMVDQVAGKVTE